MAISTRQEWYDEEYFPDVPPSGLGQAVKAIQAKLYVAGQQFGKTMMGMQVQLQVLDEAARKDDDKALANLSKWQSEFTLATGTASHQFIEAMTGFKIEPVLKDETPRDRALRLRKQSHSMTSDSHFDRRGRKRY